MKKIFFIVAICSGVFVACHTEPHTNQSIAGEEVHSATSDAIYFSRRQQEKIAFAAELPLIGLFGQMIKTTAQVQSSLSDETIISARISGIVLFSGNNLTEGRNVNAGQSLFTVSGAGLAENNSNVRFTEAQTNFRKAEADYNRAQELIKEKIISEKEFLQIKTDYETAQAVYDNLSRNFSRGGQNVSAQFAGYLKQVYVENGQFVEEGQPLALVSKNKSLILKADVSPRYAGLLPFLSSATIRGGDKITYSLEELNGKFLSFGKSLIQDNYSIPVSLQIDNKAGFLPGAFVEINLKTQSEKPAMTLPVSALTEEQGVFFVYVQLNPEAFEKREVKLGLSDGIRTEIIAGLDKTEQVVTQGAMSVKLAQATGVLDAHAH